MKAGDAWKRGVSFEGCRTRTQAEERLRVWLNQVCEASQRRLETDMLARIDDFGGDVNQIADALDGCAAFTLEGIETFMEQARAMLDRQLGPE